VPRAGAPARPGDRPEPSARARRRTGRGGGTPAAHRAGSSALLAFRPVVVGSPLSHTGIFFEPQVFLTAKRVSTRSSRRHQVPAVPALTGYGAGETGVQPGPGVTASGSTPLLDWPAHPPHASLAVAAAACTCAARGSLGRRLPLPRGVHPAARGSHRAPAHRRSASGPGTPRLGATAAPTNRGQEPERAIRV
jgi:hypothetical protein